VHEALDKQHAQGRSDDGPHQQLDCQHWVAVSDAAVDSLDPGASKDQANVGNKALRNACVLSVLHQKMVHQPTLHAISCGGVGLAVCLLG
jgi:hypothetical protein